MFYFQLVIMAGTVLLAYYFEYTDTFPVHIQGFFCYDKSFSKPYPGADDTSKIPPMLIYSLVTAIPTLTTLRADRQGAERSPSPSLRGKCVWMNVCVERRN
ncbi:hypothetical protein ILYODFUR_010378 [Ilyodon furcidens]|uniref:Uncharacterized protein n=1 Tax=Ilyodon furcidens TaxID=33524 RepID=A0ABV0THR5_9TELE